MLTKDPSKLLSIAVLTMLVTSCNNGARIENMTVGNLPNADFGKYSHNIRLENAENVTRWDTRVSDEDFYAALQNSLYSNDLSTDDRPQYGLTADIVQLTPPSEGFDMHVTSDVQYIIRDIRTDKIVVDKTIENVGVASVNDEPMSISRKRVVDERAINGNITQFMNYLRR